MYLLFIILSKIFLYQEFLLLFQPTLICSQPSWIRAASIGYNYRLLLFWLIHYLCYYIKYYLFKIFFYNLKNVNSKDNLRTFITLLFILFIYCISQSTFLDIFTGIWQVLNSIFLFVCIFCANFIKNKKFPSYPFSGVRKCAVGK